MILGIVGPIGSGKDTAADYISRKYGYEIVSFRDIVREVTEGKGMEPSRENMQDVARECRARYGEDYFSKRALEKGMALLKNGRKVLFKEMRTKGDADLLRKEFGSGIRIILVESGKRTRYERLKARGRLGDPKTFGEFHAQETREREMHFTESFSFADTAVKNNGTLKELHDRIDEVVK